MTIILISDNRIFESANTLRSENLQLSIKNEQLRQESTDIHKRTGPIDGKSNEKVQALEQKMSQQQEELTVLLRTKGENAQALVELNRKLNEREKLLSIREQR
jgi:autophagy-related protein 16